MSSFLEFFRGVFLKVESGAVDEALNMLIFISNSGRDHYSPERLFPEV